MIEFIDWSRLPGPILLGIFGWFAVFALIPLVIAHIVLYDYDYFNDSKLAKSLSDLFAYLAGSVAAIALATLLTAVIWALML